MVDRYLSRKSGVNLDMLSDKKAFFADGRRQTTDISSTDTVKQS